MKYLSAEDARRLDVPVIVGPCMGSHAVARVLTTEGHRSVRYRHALDRRGKIYFAIDRESALEFARRTGAKYIGSYMEGASDA